MFQRLFAVRYSADIPLLQFLDVQSLTKIVAILNLFFSYCVVPENIQTPTTEGIGNSEGVGGSMAQEIPKGRGVSRPNSLPDGREND